MKTIFTPSIQVVNKLRYPQKLLLLATIAIIVVSIMTYQLTRQSYTLIKATQAELKGVDYIKGVTSVLQKIQDYRHLELTYFLGEQSLKDKLAGARDEVDQSFSEMQGVVNAFEINPLLHNAWDKIKLDWDADESLEDYQKAILAKVKALKAEHKEDKAACEKAIADLDINLIIAALDAKEPEEAAEEKRPTFVQVLSNLLKSQGYQEAVKALREETLMSAGFLAPNKLVNKETGEKAPRLAISDLVLYMARNAKDRELREESGIRVTGRAYPIGRLAAEIAASGHPTLAEIAAKISTLENDPFTRTLHFISNVGAADMQAIADEVPKTLHEQKFTAKFVPWAILEETLRVTDAKKGFFAVSDGVQGAEGTRDIRAGSDLSVLLGLSQLLKQDPKLFFQMEPVTVGYERHPQADVLLGLREALKLPAPNVEAGASPAYVPQQVAEAAKEKVLPEVEVVADAASKPDADPAARQRVAQI